MRTLLFNAILFGVIGSASAADLGSILVFPLYDASTDVETLISVTNTNTNDVSCGDGFKDGDVVLDYAYVDGTTQELARVSESLTPGDTLSVLVSRHLPSPSQSGYLIVSATDAATGARTRFDYLAGKAVVVTGDTSRAWAYTAYPVTASATSGPVECKREPTDVDGEGDADLDGIEYERPLATLLVPVFIEEGIVSNRIVLLSLASDTTNYEVEVWNNDEDLYVRRPVLPSWWSGSLSGITQTVTNLRGDPTELPRVNETGWMRLTATEEGTDLSVPLFGVFVQTVDGKDYTEGIVLPTIGEQSAPNFSFP